MPTTVAEHRKAGRPAEGPLTVRILPTGVIRLSPDLCTAKTFTVAVDAEKKLLIVKPRGPFDLWYSNPRAKSGHLTIRPVFELLGLDPRSVAGEYTVRRLKAEGFMVELEER